MEREPLITKGLLMLFSSSHLVVTGEKTHTVVPYANTVVVCLVNGGGSLVNMGPLRLFSSSVMIGIDPHSGSVYPHSGCLCYERMEGASPNNRGARKVILCEKGGRGGEYW